MIRKKSGRRCIYRGRTATWNALVAESRTATSPTVLRDLKTHFYSKSFLR